MPVRSRRVWWSVALFLLAGGVAAARQASSIDPAARGVLLRQALSFHASFDGSLDAAYATGDARLYSAPTLARRAEAAAGLPASGEIVHAKGAGKFGDALRFTQRRKPAVFFQARANVPYAPVNWSGTVSFWLSVDPAAELENGFCDPVQVTPNTWNDAAFFVEFEKSPQAIPFRLGVYADLNVWNPTGRKFEDIPPVERPLITVDTPPFGAGKWTHVVFTFDRFNTGRADGVARLYLDGAPAGQLSPRQQTFTWDPAKAVINLGAGYIGMMDEVSVFNRALSDADVAALHGLAGGVASLLVERGSRTRVRVLPSRHPRQGGSW